MGKKLDCVKKHPENSENSSPKVWKIVLNLVRLVSGKVYWNIAERPVKGL